MRPALARRRPLDGGGQLGIDEGRHLRRGGLCPRLRLGRRRIILRRPAGRPAVPHGPGLGAPAGHEGGGRPAFAARDLGHGALGRHRLVVVARPTLVARHGGRIVMLDQQPGRLARIGALGAHQHPGAMHPLPLHDELQFARIEGLADRLEALFRRPIAPVPQHHRAAAVLALGDGPLEIAVVEGVVLHLHRQPADLGVEGGALGHGPGPEGPAKLQAQVEMQMAGRVLLDDEAQGVRRQDLVVLPGRFTGLREVPHLLVLGDSARGH